MKIQIDLKSAVCGLIIGVAAMFALGADSSSSNQAGRYQIVIGGNPPVFLEVDTTTGRVWEGNGNVTQLKSEGNFFDPK